MLDGIKSLLKAVLKESTQVDLNTRALFTVMLVSPIHIRTDAAAAAAVQPNLITNKCSQLTVFIIISLCKTNMLILGVCGSDGARI